MNKLIYILVGMIYIQAVLSMGLPAVDLSAVTMADDMSCHIDLEIGKGSTSCCTTKNVEKKSCCASKTFDANSEKGSCDNDNNCEGDCECPCCYHSSPVIVACFVDYKRVKTISNFREDILSMKFFHAFDYKFEDYHPPKVG